MKPYKHAELIKAWADGAEIQYKNDLGEWETWDGYNAPPWYSSSGYRIKPKPNSLDQTGFMHQQTKPLSDDEIEQLREYHGINDWLYETSVTDFARAIEERHGIK